MAIQVGQPVPWPGAAGVAGPISSSPAVDFGSPDSGRRWLKRTATATKPRIVSHDARRRTVRPPPAGRALVMATRPMTTTTPTGMASSHGERASRAQRRSARRNGSPAAATTTSRAGRGPQHHGERPRPSPVAAREGKAALSRPDHPVHCPDPTQRRFAGASASPRRPRPGSTVPRLVELFANLNDATPDPAGWARAREAEGWDGVACADHYFSVGRSVRAFPHVWASLGAMAAATSRVRLQPAFGNNLLRSPVELAQAVLMVHAQSGGRAEARRRRRMVEGRGRRPSACPSPRAPCGPGCCARPSSSCATWCRPGCAGSRASTTGSTSPSSAR